MADEVCLFDNRQLTNRRFTHRHYTSVMQRRSRPGLRPRHEATAIAAIWPSSGVVPR
jgi:hypothetical protein